MGETRGPPDPAKQLLSFAASVKDALAAWKEAIAAAVLLVSSAGETALGLLQNWMGLPAPAAKAITVVLFLLALWLGWRAYRTQRNRPADEPSAPPPRGLAFRGLDRFRRGDELPGTDRRRLAVRVAQRVLDAQTTMVIVAGASGAGKSSLLQSAVTGLIEKEGVGIALVGSPARLAAVGAAAGTSADVDHLLAALTARIAPQGDAGTRPQVLVLDQFEEFFTRFLDKELRARVGAWLRDCIAAGVRPVLGLREEYLAQLADMLAPQNISIALTDTMLVENFSEVEAAAIVEECARRDSITLDPGLPAAIAADLSQKGAVRPAELQIVCTALGQSLTLEEYRRRGGAAGVISSHVLQAARQAADQVLAQAILRGLCDIPAGTKRPEPLTSRALLTELPQRVRDTATESSVERVLGLLEQARLVIAIGELPPRQWSLIHDYLVEPIKLATQGESLRSEEASAKLQGYVAQARKGGRPVVPLADLRLIRLHGRPEELARPEVRTLLRRAAIVGYGTPTAVAFGAGLVAVVGVGLAATRWGVWHTNPHSALGFWDGMESGVPATGRRWTGRRSRVDARGPTEAPVVVTYSGRPDFLDFGIPSPWRMAPFDRLVLWNASTGERIGDAHGEGLLPFGRTHDHFWTSQGGMQTLNEVGMDGRVRHSIDLRGEQRPALLDRIFDVTREVVIASTQGGAPWIFDVQAKRWAGIDPSPSFFPQTISDGRSWSMGRLLVFGGLMRELTVVDSLTGRVHWRQAAPGASVESIVVRDSGGGEHDGLLLIRPESVTIIRFPELLQQVDGTVRSAGDPQSLIIATPPRLAQAWRARQQNLDEATSFRFESNPFYFEAVPGRLLFVEAADAAPQVWPLNIAEQRFEEPHLSSVPMPRIMDGIAWTPQGRRALALWPRSQSAPTMIDGLETAADDFLLVTPDALRLLVLRGDGKSAELWDVPGGRRIDRMVFDRVVTPSLTDDSRAALLREPGGRTFVWRTADGRRLGWMTVASRVSLSTYDPTCERLVVWTEEDQRLVYRKGADIPLIGHWPSTRC